VSPSVRWFVSAIAIFCEAIALTSLSVVMVPVIQPLRCFQEKVFKPSKSLTLWTATAMPLNRKIFFKIIWSIVASE
jgi:hypothetical protein